MKATVIVMLKPTVLDPQGSWIVKGIQQIGMNEISEIRQGKHFDITIKDDQDPQQARAALERLAKEVLTNPVIEQYQIIFEGGQE